MYIPNEKCVLFRVTEEKYEKDSFNHGWLDGEKCQNFKKVFGISKKKIFIFYFLNFKLHSVVKRGLLLGLKFILYPKAQCNSLSTLITVYTQEAKHYLENVVQAGGKLVFKQNKQLYTTPK
jgi:hypothetical protein